MLANLKFVDNKGSVMPKYQRMANCIEPWLGNSPLPKGTKLPCDRELAENRLTEYGSWKLKIQPYATRRQLQKGNGK